MNRKDILKKAEQAVNQRGENYGSPEQNFERIAQLWSSYADHEFQIEDVGVMMMLVKVARLMQSPHHEDSWVDIAGYSAITGEAIANTSHIQRLPVGQQSKSSSLSGRKNEG